MFERFTEKAIKAIMLAQEEAQRLGQDFVGTEMILLGLLGEGTGLAAQALHSMGLNLEDTRVEVEKIIDRGSGCVLLQIPFTPHTKRLLDLSWGAARLTKCNYVGTEHLLLGLIEQENGVLAKVLIDEGVDLAALRTKVLDLLRHGLEKWKTKNHRNEA